MENVAILAYNKKIADEIASKLIDLKVDWKTAQAGTVHSFGFKILRKFLSNVVVDEKKVSNLIKQNDPSFPYPNIVCDLVSLAKQRAIGKLTPITDYSAWMDIVNHFDMIDDEINSDDLDMIIKMSIDMLKLSNKTTSVVDFDDMVYLPLMLPVRPWRFSTIIVDEAQDTNPARRELVKLMLRAGGRVFAVGDHNQAIYGFTGADNDSLEYFVKDFHAKRMPLTVTYRCPKAVVSFARQWVSHIEAHETAPQGSVTTLDIRNGFTPSATSAILCRNTKPLIDMSFYLIRNRIPCKVEGRDIAKGLVKLVNKWKSCKTIDAYENKLERWIITQRARLADGPKRDMVEDQYETIKAIITFVQEEKKTHMTDVVEWIESLFADNVTGVVTLSTIHKSKGREWNTVYWLNRSKTCPSKYATQPWMMEQERNLMYVCATRSQNELIEIER